MTCLAHIKELKSQDKPQTTTLKSGETSSTRDITPAFLWAFSLGNLSRLIIKIKKRFPKIQRERGKKEREREKNFKKREK